MTDYTQIQVRQDTSARWASINPILLAGEFGYATDTKILKKGDGTTTWNNLPTIAEKATTLAGYGITNAYTKAEVDAALNSKANKSTTYTKIDVDTIATGKANVGLDNLNANGQMVVDSQNGTISNCILEIPQNIKLTLENNVLTLKAGSVVTNTGTTYSTTTTTQDYSTTFSTNGKYYVIFTGYSLLNWFNFESVSSGSSLPETVTLNHRFFNVTNKQWYYADSNNTEWTLATIWSYPLAIIEVSNGVASFAKDSNGNDMIFNGAGFIGHHAFVYPNVKVLIPNGFNTDGSLKSEVWESNQLFIRESETNVTNYGLMLQATYPYLNYSNKTYWQYSNEQNKFIHNQNSILFTELANFSVDSNNVVTDFTIRQPYDGARNLLTDELQADVTTLTGYDSTQTQTLKNINGVLQWVTD